MTKSLRRLAGSLKWEDERHTLYDEWTAEVIKRVTRPESNCVDVGSHEGDILRHMVAHAPRGTHFAFEPLPAQANRLRAKFPSVQVFEMALAEAPGTSPFRQITGGAAGFSGFERRPADTYDERDVEIIQVHVARLDDIIPADVPIRFIKIDVEGAEHRVLVGAIRTLKSHQPFVAFELSHSPELAYELLSEKAGLSISLLKSWLKGKGSLSRDEFVNEWASGRQYFFLAHPA